MTLGTCTPPVMTIGTDTVHSACFPCSFLSISSCCSRTPVMTLSTDTVHSACFVLSFQNFQQKKLQPDWKIKVPAVPKSAWDICTVLSLFSPSQAHRQTLLNMTRTMQLAREQQFHCDLLAFALLNPLPTLTKDLLSFLTTCDLHAQTCLYHLYPFFLCSMHN